MALAPPSWIAHTSPVWGSKLRNWGCPRPRWRCCRRWSARPWRPRGPVVPDALVLPLLEHAEQLALELERDLPDLVEEQGPAVGGGEAPHPVAPRGLTSTAAQLHFIPPGKPVQNAYLESFNGTSLDDVQEDRGLATGYNGTRPHSAPGNLPPSECAARFVGTEASNRGLSEETGPVKVGQVSNMAIEPSRRKSSHGNAR